jgi:hypothetical protein
LKKTIIILFVLSAVLVITSCGDSSNSKKKDAKQSQQILNEEPSGLIKYNRHWIGIQDRKQNAKQQLEIYISELGDTIYNQHKTYINEELDSTKSDFYELDLSLKSEGNYQGNIILHSSDDHKIKSPIIERRLNLYLLNREDSLNVDFISKNKNSIQFSYNSSDDTLRGVLIDTRQIDTVVNGENMVRLIESVLFVDNKSQTINTLIKEFAKKKN